MPISFVSYADRSLERSDLVSNGHYTWLQSGLSNLSGISGRFKRHFPRDVRPVLRRTLSRWASGEWRRLYAGRTWGERGPSIGPKQAEVLSAGPE